MIAGVASFRQPWRSLLVLTADAFRRLCQARDLLAGPAGNPPSVRAVARQVHISPYHFIRQFAALFGLTPHQFRIEARIHQAKQRLAMEQPVTQVCLDLGLSSVGSFSHQFARRAGASPSAYRRQASGSALHHLPGCLTLMAALPPDAFRNFREAPNATLS